MGAPIIIAEQPTASQLIKMLVSEYMSGKEHLYSMKYIYRIFTFSTVFDITNPTLDLNFSDFGWEFPRWDAFCQQYLDQDFLNWLRSLDKLPGSAESGYSFRSAKHTHGNCVVHLSFHTNPEPMLTMYSRASNLVPTSILELSLANLIAIHLFKHYHQSIRIRWMTSQMQFSTVFAFYYLYCGFTPEEREQWGDGDLVKRYRRLEERFKLYQKGQLIPKYHREEDPYQRILKKPQSWTPTYFLIDQKKYPIDVTGIFDFGGKNENR